MSLRILSVAYPFAPVGPHAVGGAEQVLTDLDAAIVSSGGSSVVVASHDSAVEGRLYGVPAPAGELDEAARVWGRKRCQAALDRALAENEIDLLHCHGLDFTELRLPRNLPVLVTLHMPPAWYPESMWQAQPANVQLQCVSETQRRSCPEAFRRLPVVVNGVAIPPAAATLRAEFALALGRICPEKNLHAALDAGTQARVPVLLGGQVFPYREHLAYFHEQIEPRLGEHDGVRHSFLGPLPPERKHALLASARCLLLPTLAPETSSLVAMEALAAGTPVIAFRSGAIPEIVQDGVTGFLVDSAEAMAEAMMHVDGLDRELCRATAMERFSVTRMTTDYFSLYERLTQRFRGRRRLLA